MRAMRRRRWENEAEEGGEKFEGYESGNLERGKMQTNIERENGDRGRKKKIGHE